MSLTVWAGAPDSFIRLDCDGVGRLKRLPRLFALKIAKGPDRNLTLFLTGATSQTAAPAVPPAKKGNKKTRQLPNRSHLTNGSPSSTTC